MSRPSFRTNWTRLDQGFWLIGLSLGVSLAFFAGGDGPQWEFGGGIGVAGLWWGLVAGLTTTCVVGTVLLFGFTVLHADRSFVSEEDVVGATR
jgi:Na+-driven multidrug efflux pump